MSGRLRQFGVVAASALALMLVAAESFTLYRRHQEHDSRSDVQKIARSLAIIRDSTPEHPGVLKVLFYGQSITRSGWGGQVVAHWRERYPNTVFVVQNRALGGFSSESLERTAAQDVNAFFPDLIIFHDYGDHHAYERILRIFRSQTAADVILQTDHGDTVPDPVCPEGLQLSLHRPAGCAGFGWLHQRTWNDEMSYHHIPALAKKYAFAIEPQRQWWRDFYLRTGARPASFLVDSVHPNARGKELLATFFDRYFDLLVSAWNNESEDLVLDAVPEPDHRTIHFTGTRLEFITAAPLPAPLKLQVDGADPATLDGCYQATRATGTSSVPEWPAIRRINLLHDHTAEDWTATITHVSADQNTVNFHVESSINGDEGSGDSAHTFTARSGLLSLEPQDWMFPRAYLTTHQPLQTPFVVRWSVIDVCTAPPEIIDLGHGRTQYRSILAAGLPDRDHTVVLAEPLVSAGEFRAYQPPLTSP